MPISEKLLKENSLKSIREFSFSFFANLRMTEPCPVGAEGLLYEGIKRHIFPTICSGKITASGRGKTI